MDIILRFIGQLNLLKLFGLAAFLALGFSTKAQVSFSDATVCGACDGSAQMVSAWPGALSYVWTDVSGSVVFSEINSVGSSSVSTLCVGIYFVSVADAFGQNETSAFDISIAGVNNGTSSNVTVCNTGLPLDLDGAIGNSFLPGGIWIDPIGNVIAPLVNPAFAQEGLYTYTADAGGCMVESGVDLEVLDNANPGLSTTYLICATYGPFFMTDLLAGNPDYGGQWFDQTAQPMDGWYVPAVMSTSLFTYMLDMVPGCDPVFSTMMVVENQVPDPGLDAVILVCDNAPVFPMINELGGTPQAGGQWFDENNNVVPGVFDTGSMAEGVYRYHLNAATPCFSQDAFLAISFTPANPAGIPTDVQVCESDSPFSLLNSLDGNPIAGGVWTNGQGNVVPDVFDPQISTTQSLFYTYPSVGCGSNTTLLYVDVNAQPDAGLSASAMVCASQNSFDLSNFYQPGILTNGAWSDANGLIAGTVIPISSAGNFSFTYTLTETNCPSDSENYFVQVDQPLIPIADVGVEICVSDAPIDLSDEVVTTNATTFFDPQGNVVPQVFDPAVQFGGNYLAVIASGNTCPQDVVVIAIVIDQPLFTDQQIDVAVCESQGSFDLNSVSNQVDFTTGNWLDENAQVVSSVVNPLYEGVKNFSFTLASGNTCPPSTIAVELETNGAVNAGNDSAIEVCVNDEAIAFASLQPADSDAGSFFYNNSVVASAMFNPQVDPVGVYQYIVPANGACVQDVADINITVNAGFSFDAGADVSVCAGSNPVEIGQAPLGGCTYQWFPATNLSDANAANPSVDFSQNISAQQTTNYVVEVSNGICENSDTIVVVVYPLPVATIIGNAATCPGEVVTLSVSDGDNFDWQPQNLFTNNSDAQQSFVPENSTTVTVSVENEWGCGAQGSIDVIVYPNPEILFDLLNSTGCSPLEFQLENLLATENASYWLEVNGQQFNLDSEATNLVIEEDGEFELTITAISDMGCMVQEIFPETIVVHSNPIADFISDPTSLNLLENVAQFENTSTGAEEFLWTFDEQGSSTEENPEFTFMAAQEMNFNVCLEAVSEFGCADSVCKILHMDNVFSFYAPNAFTPDDDGVNDIFLPVFMGFDLAYYSLKIFDRWGQPVFETTDVRKAWIGNVDGGDYYAGSGAYVWIAKLKDSDSAEYVTYKGHLLLVR